MKLKLTFVSGYTEVRETYGGTGWSSLSVNEWFDGPSYASNVKKIEVYEPLAKAKEILSEMVSMEGTLIPTEAFAKIVVRAFENQKIPAIKYVKSIVPSIGLKEAKDAVEDMFAEYQGKLS